MDKANALLSEGRGLKWQGSSTDLFSHQLTHFENDHVLGWYEGLGPGSRVARLPCRSLAYLKYPEVPELNSPALGKFGDYLIKEELYRLLDVCMGVIRPFGNILAEIPFCDGLHKSYPPLCFTAP